MNIKVSNLFKSYGYTTISIYIHLDKSKLLLIQPYLLFLSYYDLDYEEAEK